MRLLRLQIVGIITAICVLVSCQSNSPPAVRLNPDECVEAGRVLPASAWDTARTFRRAGVPMYLTGEEYPGAQRILVRPEDRERAVLLLQDLEHRPTPYLVTPGQPHDQTLQRTGPAERSS